MKGKEIIRMQTETLGLREEKFGYETIGPLLVSYCKWIHDIIQKRNIKDARILFAARDGYYFYKTYKILFPEDNAEYFYISRKCLRLPLLYLDQSVENIESVLGVGGKRSIESIMNMLSLDDMIGDMALFGINTYKKIRICEISKNKKLVSFFNNNKEGIKERASAQYKLIRHYLIDHGFATDNIVLVDYGYKGSIQVALSKLQMDIFDKCTIHGCYLACTNEIDKRLNSDRFDSFVNEYDKNGVYEIRKGGNLLEKILLADHGTTIGLKNIDEKIVPVLKDKANEKNAVLKSIHAGMKRFVLDYNDRPYKHDADAKETIEGIIRFITSPTMEDLEMVSDIVMDLDGKLLKKCISIECATVYNPVKLINGLFKSDWKYGYIAYVTRNTSMAAGIYRGYKFLKHEK